MHENAQTFTAVFLRNKIQRIVLNFLEQQGLSLKCVNQ